MARTSLCLASLLVTIISTIGSEDLVIHLLYGKHVHCFPTICTVGFQASFCKRNRTRDYCHVCPYGSRQDRVVDSKTVYATEDIPKCSRVDIACLMPETTPVVENGQIVRCECDLSKGYFGRDPLCMKANSCPAGQELIKISGRCRICQTGSFKTSSGYEFCKPWTSCETIGRETLKVGNATTDTVCGKQLPTTRIKTSVYPTAHTVSMTFKCGTGDCLSKGNLRESKADVMDITLKHQNITYKSHPEDCKELSNLYIIVILTSMIIILSIIFGFMILHRKIKRTRMNGFRPPSEKIKDAEKCLKSGIQEENETPKHKERGTVAEKSILIDDYVEPAGKMPTPIAEEEQPNTIYPPINEHPAEPTAPELSMQGSLQHLIHDPPRCNTSAAQNDGVKIYFQKKNYH